MSEAFLRSMLRHTPVGESPRKLRLLACGCARRLWPLMKDVRSREALSLAERSADESIPYAILDGVSAAAEEAYEDSEPEPGVGIDRLLTHAASYASNPDLTAEHVLEVMDSLAAATAWAEDRERAAQFGLFLCIFGSRLKASTIEPDWRTATVVDLATGVYADRAWDRLPILADALDDAGCTDPDVIGHLRGPGPHARGCWVVDLILGKS